MIYNEVLSTQIQFSIGDGFTFLPSQFIITVFGQGNFQAEYFDVTNNLNFAGTLATLKAFTSICYNEADDTYADIYQFDTAGSFLGVVAFSLISVQINSICTDGEKL